MSRERTTKRRAPREPVRKCFRDLLAFEQAVITWGQRKWVPDEIKKALDGLSAEVELLRSPATARRRDVDARMTEHRQALTDRIVDDPDVLRDIEISDGAEDLSDEPKVGSRRDDLVGLVFSGGGIRSATFNLGLLQALNRIGLLGKVDYLSTVSGGGYIGAWWSAWLHRNRHARSKRLFPRDTMPAPDDDAPAENRPEPRAIRHLREFSRFLVPRLGAFEVETASALGHVGSIVPPSILAFVALAVWSLLAWLWTTYVLVRAPIGTAIITAVAVPVVMYMIFSRVGTGRTISEPDHRHLYSLWGNGLVAMLVIAGLWAVAMQPTLFGPSKPWRLAAPHDETGIVSTFMPRQYADGSEIRWYDEATGAELPRPAGDSDAARDAAAVARSRRLAKEKGWSDDGTRHYSAVYPLFPQWSIPLYLPSLLWFAAFLVLVLLRQMAWRFARHGGRRTLQATANRIMGRLLITAVLWAAFAVIWQAGALVILREYAWSVAGLSAVATALFHLTRGYFSRDPGAERRGGFREVLKAYIPMVLATVALASTLVLIACGVYAVSMTEAWSIDAAGIYMPPISWLLAVSSVVVLATLLFFDPTMVSLHAFYRSRLARAYLGASNRLGEDPQDVEVHVPVWVRAAFGLRALWAGAIGEEDFGDDMRARYIALERAFVERRRSFYHFAAIQNRFTEERRTDDVPLSDLVTLRPVHLVCCAANDLSGDRLKSLNRGARSAVLSAAGLSLGGRWYDESDTGRLWLSQAITASGAAFNSNMGSLSARLGGAAAVLLTAFNLRLGLWVDLKRPWTGRWLTSGQRTRPALTGPGLRFFKEMFGRTRASVSDNTEVHLSDGGHFENLGLYELIRRQCRFIVVSDCGADPDVVFEDVGNAMQLIREDFSVEIDIDLSPLKPNAQGIARQHMVVGRIRYPNSRHGILLVFKPTMTGDEPEDVQQYRSQNPSFPHETTGDQFYDEAQWESYRSLGEHAGTSAFAFFGARLSQIASLDSDIVFQRVFDFWQPAPIQVLDNFLPVSTRYSALIGRITAEAGSGLLGELFPETTGHGREDADYRHYDPASEAKRMALVLEVGQFMEDTWFSCLLDTHEHHASNAGWVDVFGRFVAMPSFQRWWSLLRGNFSPKFVEYLQDRFEELHVARAASAWRVVRTDVDQPSLVALPTGDDGKPLPEYAEGWSFVYVPAGRPDSGFAVALMPDPAPLVSNPPSDEDDESIVLPASRIVVAHALRGSGLAARFVKEFSIHRYAQARGELGLSPTKPGVGDGAPAQPNRLLVTFEASRSGQTGATEQLYKAVAPYLARAAGTFIPDAQRVEEAEVLEDDVRTGALTVNMYILWCDRYPQPPVSRTAAG